jgi:hypothetical protein
MCGIIDILSRLTLLITGRNVEAMTVGANYGMKGADFERDFWGGKWYLLSIELND